MTECVAAPLIPFDEEEGSFFKVYLADTGLMFYKLGINPRLWLEAEELGAAVASSDFRGALAENSTAQALSSNNLQTYYWTPPTASTSDFCAASFNAAERSQHSMCDFEGHQKTRPGQSRPRFACAALYFMIPISKARMRTTATRSRATGSPGLRYLPVGSS